MDRVLQTRKLSVLWNPPSSRCQNRLDMSAIYERKNRSSQGEPHKMQAWPLWGRDRSKGVKLELSRAVAHRSMKGTAILREILRPKVPAGGVTSVFRMGLLWCPTVLGAWLGRGPWKLGWCGSSDWGRGKEIGQLSLCPRSKRSESCVLLVATLRD